MLENVSVSFKLFLSKKFQEENMKNKRIALIALCVIAVICLLALGACDKVKLVTFESNGGSTVDEILLLKGESAQLPPP